jgi:xanthine/CO dehydrogenase XdhC/CoxF family maturation factor
MLLTEERWVAGSVSNGCLERDIVLRGFWHLRKGEPVLITYDSTRTDEDALDARWSMGLGCEGIVDVLLERPGTAAIDPLRFIETCHQAQRHGVIATVFRSSDPSMRAGARLTLSGSGLAQSSGIQPLARERILEHARAALARRATSVVSIPAVGGTAEVLMESIAPPPRLHVFGASQDAVPVAELAERIGWDVAVCERVSRAVTHQRFASVDATFATVGPSLANRIDTSAYPLALLMNNDDDADREALSMLLGSQARYIGIVGTRQRGRRLMADLGRNLEDDFRVHAPAGMDLGGESPQESALSIVAEMQSALRRARGPYVRDYLATPFISQIAC